MVDWVHRLEWNKMRHPNGSPLPSMHAHNFRTKLNGGNRHWQIPLKRSSTSPKPRRQSCGWRTWNRWWEALTMARTRIWPRFESTYLWMHKMLINSTLDVQLSDSTVSIISYLYKLQPSIHQYGIGCQKFTTFFLAFLLVKLVLHGTIHYGTDVTFSGLYLMPYYSLQQWNC